MTPRALPPPGRTHVVGILNLTPDSFSDGGRFGGARTAGPDAGRDSGSSAPGAVFRPDVEAVLAAARRMVADGAALLDIGAVSTRPGAGAVPPDEEWARLAPVLGPLRAAVGVPLSLDTSSAAVLERALEAGVDLLNDVSALGDDPRMAAVAAASGLPVVLMHRRGSPATMQLAPHYADAPAEVLAELMAAVARAEAAGIAHGRLVLDPGIGFGKRPQDNVALLAALPRFVADARAAGMRTLLGCSRKAFLGGLIARDGEAPRPLAEREHATTATTVLAALAGTDFVRVHDVRAAADALAVTAAVAAAGAVRTPTVPGAPPR